jgi:hypothetical protein
MADNLRENMLSLVYVNQRPRWQGRAIGGNVLKNQSMWFRRRFS